MSLFGFDDDGPKRRAAPKALRRMVWIRDRGICQVCKQPADAFDWELGHDRAVSRGGKLTLKNTFVVHPNCNRSMSTLTKSELAKKLGLPTGNPARDALKGLSLRELKALAEAHRIRVKGRVVSGGWLSEDRKQPPTKRAYVNALAKVIRPEDVRKELDGIGPTLRAEDAKRARKKKDSSSWW